MIKFYLWLLTLVTATVNFASANELKIYVITPQFPINWSGPQSLAVTTAANSANNDYAPIGHFAIEVKCEVSSRYGVNHLLTGMERKNKKESQQITLDKKLGLGSLTYPFKGAMQSSLQSLKEITQAARDQRLKIIKIPTTALRCHQMLVFIEDWIKWGSYTIYGGGKKTGEGEGAGCADFAMEFFKMATNRPVPKDWLVKINVPHALVGDGEGKEVPFTDVLATKFWAGKGKGVHFEIADTNKVDQWLAKHLKMKNGVYVFDQHTKTGNQNDYYQRPNFRFFYYPPVSASQVWNSIKL